MAQFVFLVHHADAVPPDVDHTRPLSSIGVAQAERVAHGALERGAKPSLVWHSGKLRARQTAEICTRVLNPFAPINAVRGLQPDDNPETIVNALAAEPSDVLIAGHMPFLPALLQRLTAATGSVQFPPNGCVALERLGDTWEERWRVAP
ncbi:MAG TPA: histidine phosphatase family protein [Vicinamibacterales bacterium]|nr:histidine phosphatase family protein [Vicinamibacterales bacterium]